MTNKEKQQRKEKIILMTKLAVYEKENSGRDQRINDYFLHDYIYKCNMWTRFSAIIGAVIVIFFIVLHKIFIESVDLFASDYVKELKSAVVLIVFLLVVYTVISTIKATMEYRTAQKRLNAYIQLLDELNGLKIREKEDIEEDTDLYYGTDINYSSNDNQDL